MNNFQQDKIFKERRTSVEIQHTFVLKLRQEDCIHIVHLYDILIKFFPLISDTYTGQAVPSHSKLVYP